jgi:GPH family glycoside/pentoside/hexuronide:cation symporter
MQKTSSNPKFSGLGWGEKIGLSVSGTATSLIWSTIGGFLTYFYTDVMGLSLALVGTIFLVTRIWDMVSDFLMGLVADRTNTRWGKFRPWILWSCVPFGVLSVLSFVAPDFGTSGKIFWAAGTYFLLMTLYTMTVVPCGALIGVVTDDANERTRLAVIGGIFGALGGFLSSSATLPLVKFFGQGNEAVGFQWTLVLFAVIATVLYLTTFLSVRERVQPPKSQHDSVRVDVKDLLQNRPWVLVFIVGVVAALASASRVGVSVHFFKYNLGDQDLTTHLRSIGVVCGLLGAVCTPLAGRFFGKGRSLGMAVLIVGLSSAALYFATPERLWVAYVSTVLTDFFGGIVITMFVAMLGDTADYNEWLRGRRATGIIYAAGSVSLKTGFAFGGLIVSGVLGYYGYEANAVQTERSLFGIAMAAAIVPGILFSLASLPMLFYPLTTAKLEEIKLELERRREAEAAAG